MVRLQKSPKRLFSPAAIIAAGATARWAVVITRSSASFWI
jgi:hypothetical protein